MRVIAKLCLQPAKVRPVPPAWSEAPQGRFVLFPVSADAAASPVRGWQAPLRLPFPAVVQEKPLAA